MTYIGSWKVDDLLTFVCNTQVFTTGVATDADSVPTYRVYEDETTTPILTGSMALLDSANTAGFYSEQITLSAANGFEKGKCYSIYIAATVSSVAGATHRTFQIEAEVDANRLNWANVDNPTTALNLSGTNIDVDQVVASVTGAVGSVTGAVGSVTGNVSGNVTGSVGSVVGAVGSVTGAVGSVAGNVVGSVGSVAGNVTGSVGSVAGNVVGSVGSVAGNVVGSVGSVVGLNAAFVDVAISSRLASASYTVPPTANANADALLDRADGIEVGLTPRQLWRVCGAAIGGKLSGGGTGTETFRNAVADSKDRMIVTDDSSGNRTAIVYDLT